MKKVFNLNSDDLCVTDVKRFFLIKLKTLHFIFIIVLQDCSIHTDITKLIILFWNMYCNSEINLFIIIIIDSKCKEIDHVQTTWLYLFNILKDIITLFNNIKELHTAVIITYLFFLNAYSLTYLNQLLNRYLYIYIFFFYYIKSSDSELNSESFLT